MLWPVLMVQYHLLIHIMFSNMPASLTLLRAVEGPDFSQGGGPLPPLKPPLPGWLSDSSVVTLWLISLLCVTSYVNTRQLSRLIILDGRCKPGGRKGARRLQTYTGQTGRALTQCNTVQAIIRNSYIIHGRVSLPVTSSYITHEVDYKSCVVNYYLHFCIRTEGPVKLIAGHVSS